MYIRKAENLRDLEAVWRLTHDAYVKQGYCSPQPEGLLKHYLHLDTIPETSVFMAFDENDRLVGTNSLTPDNPAGLHVDDDFKDKTDEVRLECLRTRKKMGASWRIATDETVHNQISIMMGLISATMDQAMLQDDLDVFLFTFNPKHVRFYERMLGLKVIAEPRFGKAVKSAPAVLMRGDRTEILKAWERTCSRRKSTRIPECMSTAVSTRAFAPAF